MMGCESRGPGWYGGLLAGALALMLPLAGIALAALAVPLPAPKPSVVEAIEIENAPDPEPALVVVAAVIWAAYGFRFEPWPDRSVLRDTSSLGSVAGTAVDLAASWRLLPEAFLEGVRFQLEHENAGHPAYLLGQVSTTGWPHYYLVAFLVKNTPGFLLAVGAAGVALWRQRRTLGPASIQVHWAPIVPSKLRALQPLVDTSIVNTLLRAVPPVAVGLSHSMLLQARAA